MDRMMDGIMGWGWLLMLLGSVLLVALIVLVVVAIIRIAGRPR
jgi:flagellar biosynthesis protein FliQ